MASRADIDELISRTEQKISDARAARADAQEAEAAAKKRIYEFMNVRRDLVEMVADDDP